MSYDCLVAFSGGVESTALVYHLKKEGRNPYCFHIKSNPGEVNTIQQKAAALDVNVTTIVVDYNPPENSLFNRQLSQEHYLKHFNKDGFPPMQQNWATIAFQIAVTNVVSDIYFGHNGGQLTPEIGYGDKFHAFGDKQYEGYTNAAINIGIDMSFSAPLAHLSKQEQYQMLPVNVQKLLYVCREGKDKHCMRCPKCAELKTICTEEQLAYYV
jgi:7-cyano-7-deazaguanine synthase in queuosine biosynthesis